MSASAPEGLHRWRDAAVVSAAGFALLAGFGQFGVVALLGDIAAELGEALPDDGLGAALGMTGTTIGLGLAVIRLASVGSLWAAGVADSLGRRRVLVGACALGLLLTVASAGAPTWWWFVAIFALGRPLLSGTNAVASVIAAEQTSSRDRAKAIALVGAAYAVGTGMFTIVRAVIDPYVGFRGVLLVVAVPLALVPLVGRFVEEPRRYESVRARSPDGGTDDGAGRGAARGRADAPGGRRRLLGPMRSDLVPRLAVVCAIHVASGVVTGPVNTYLFLVGERVHGFSAVGMSVLFVVSGATGLAGLLVGRWGADRIGRRPTAGVALALGALVGGVTYSGAPAAMLVGYPLFVLLASTFAPAAGSLDAELFPTSVRSTAAGWVTASHIVGQVVGVGTFGLLVDTLPIGAAVAVLVGPAALASLLYLALPETRGLELEESAPEQPT